METIEIKNTSGKVLYTHTCENNTIKITLEKAVSENAYLQNANLGSAKNYYSFIAYDTSKRLVHCVKHQETWMVKAGCFWGTLKELEEKVLQSHKSKVYLHNIELLKTL